MYDQRTADLEKALRELADEAQILVNIIQLNTRDDVCVLRGDMTIGTRKTIAEARNLVPLKQ